MNDLLEIVARSSGSTTLPSVGNILYVTETGSTTQSRLDGLGKINKPFELQRAFDVATFKDIIIIYGANPFTTYSVNKNELFIFIYTSLNINFNNTFDHKIHLYKSDVNTNIQNLENSKLNVHSYCNIMLSNCNGLSLISEQNCQIIIDSSLSNCTFKSNIKSYFHTNGGTLTNINIDNFEIYNYFQAIIFQYCIFNKCYFHYDFYDGNSINHCFFYDSQINFNNYDSPNYLSFLNNKFVRCLIKSTSSFSPPSFNGSYSTNKFIDCILFNIQNYSLRINNSTWILKNCIIHNPNVLNTLPNLGFFNCTGTCNLYLIDCKYEVPASTPYAISSNYTGELQLINCQLPTAITGGKTPTVTSNVFIGTISNINDVLDNI